MSRRLIHIASAPRVLGARDVALTVGQHDSSVIKGNIDEASGIAFADPKFVPLGTPPTMVQVKLPASVQLYTRRNSLAGAVGSHLGLNGLSSSFHLARFPFSRLLCGAPLVYHRIVSTSPLDLLISSNAGKRRPLFGTWSVRVGDGASSTNSTLSVLGLDGTVDWVASPKAVYAYCGDLLSQHLDLRSRQTRITGRGSVVLSSPSQIYRVVLGAEESFVLRKDCLVAYSTDLNKPRLSSVSDKVSIPYSLDAGSAVSQPATKTTATTTETKPSNNFFSRIASSVWDSIKAYLKGLRGEPRQFVKVQGPTVVLLSGITKREISLHNDRVKPLEEKLAQSAQDLLKKHEFDTHEATSLGLQGKPADHFKIVSIGEDGKATFHSTNSFDSYLEQKK